MGGEFWRGAAAFLACVHSGCTFFLKFFKNRPGKGALAVLGPGFSSFLDCLRSGCVCALLCHLLPEHTKTCTPHPPHPTPQNGASDGSARAFMISAGLTPPSAFALLSPARQKPVRCLYHAVRRLCQPPKGVQCNQCISASRDFAEQRWSLVGAWQRPFVPQNSTILWSLASTFDSTLAVFVKVRHY